MGCVADERSNAAAARVADAERSRRAQKSSAAQAIADDGLPRGLCAMSLFSSYITAAADKASALARDSCSCRTRSSIDRMPAPKVSR